MERFVIGTHQLHPLTVEMKQRLILQFLAPVSEYQDVSFYYLVRSDKSITFQVVGVNNLVNRFADDSKKVDRWNRLAETR